MYMLKTLCPDADSMVQGTIIDCIDGDYIETPKDKSYEVLHYQSGLTNPAARIVTNPVRPLNIVVAVARWVWLMSGNDRLADIAYYEPKVAGFTDDHLHVPGSNYGARLFNNGQRINQIGGVIRRLANDPGSRQASAVVWQPHDAVASSRDIPCTHGMFFHVRDDELHMAVTMRSNNAFRILPFNIFEFTMLQEYVSAALRIPMGDYVHWAASMHVYENEFEWDRTREFAHSEYHDSIVMPPMPFDDVTGQVNLLCQLEAKLRHACTLDDYCKADEMARDTLNSYWYGLFAVLFCHTVVKHKDVPDTAMVPEYLRAATEKAINLQEAVRNFR